MSGLPLRCVRASSVFGIFVFFWSIFYYVSHIVGNYRTLSSEFLRHVAQICKYICISNSTHTYTWLHREFIHIYVYIHLLLWVSSSRNHQVKFFLHDDFTSLKFFKKYLFSWQHLENSSDHLFKSLRCLGKVIITNFSYKH